MNKRKAYTMLVVLMMILSSCGRKDIKEKEPPVENNAVTENNIAETEYIVPAVPGIDRNDFSAEEFGTAQKETIPEDTKVENPESMEEIPTTSETLDIREDSQKIDVENKSETEYQRYMEMSGIEQKVFIESFDSMEAFFEWLDDARAYDESVNGSIVIEGDTIDLSKVS